MGDGSAVRGLNRHGNRRAPARKGSAGIYAFTGVLLLCEGFLRRADDAGNR